MEVQHFVTPVMPHNEVNQLARTHNCNCKVHPQDVSDLVYLYKGRLNNGFDSFRNLPNNLQYFLKPSYERSGYQGSIYEVIGPQKRVLEYCSRGIVKQKITEVSMRATTNLM